MRIDDLLQRLDDLGVELSPTAEGRLRFRAPRAAISPDLRAEIVAHKDEILAELEKRAGGQPLYPLFLQSGLLGDTVAIVCDSWAEDCAGMDPRDDAAPTVYSLDELSALTTLSPATVRGAHLCKQIFGGKIVGVAGRNDMNQVTEYRQG